MSSNEKRERNVAQQRQRRLAQRACGGCGERADEMIGWGHQTVPICRACKDKLAGGTKRDERICAFGILPSSNPGEELVAFKESDERTNTGSDSVIGRAARWLFGS